MQAFTTEYFFDRLSNSPVSVDHLVFTKTTRTWPHRSPGFGLRTGFKEQFFEPRTRVPMMMYLSPPTSMKTEDKVWFHGIARISEEMIEMCVPRQLHSKELWSGFARWGNCAAMKKEKCQVNAPLLFIFFSLWSVSVLYFLQIGKIFMIFI